MGWKREDRTNVPYSTMNKVKEWNLEHLNLPVKSATICKATVIGSQPNPKVNELPKSSEI
jgi:hypothetical protein